MNFPIIMPYQYSIIVCDSFPGEMEKSACVRRSYHPSQSDAKLIPDSFSHNILEYAMDSYGELWKFTLKNPRNLIKRLLLRKPSNNYDHYSYVTSQGISISQLKELISPYQMMEDWDPGVAMQAINLVDSLNEFDIKETVTRNIMTKLTAVIRPL